MRLPRCSDLQKFGEANHHPGAELRATIEARSRISRSCPPKQPGRVVRERLAPSMKGRPGKASRRPDSAAP
jgi:hypothetical protein